MRKINRGFTLVELLIAIMIIGILAGMLFLLFGPSEGKAKKETCYGNRQTILLALDSYRFAQGIGKEAYTLQSFINDNYKDTISNKNAKCPSNGIYSAGTENGNEVVVCSVHSIPSGGGGPSGNVIPGTNLFGGSGYMALNDWEQAIIDTHIIDFTIGQKFFYEGKYYVAVETLSNIYYNGNSNPNQNVWWTTKSAGGLVQLTGVSKSWDEIQNGATFQRGDILYYNGDYYVCRVGGNGGSVSITKTAPTQYNPNPYNSTPDLSGQAYAWYKLTN